MSTKVEILVVDEPQIRKLLRVALTSYGYAVIPVTNGQEALVSVARQQPDIILLDTHLGSEPNGLDVCQELREQSTTPIIMLSVSNNNQTKLAAEGSFKRHHGSHRAGLSIIFGTLDRDNLR